MNPKPSYRKNALFLTILLVLVGAVSLLWILLHRTASGSEQLVADIYQNGSLLQSIDLSAVEAPYTFTVSGDGGAVNEIEVRSGSIGITSASCPDKLCVHQGFISTSQLPITCLPNRLVIQVRTQNTEAANEAVDIIAY